ncbi:MAG: hypothetical protein KDB91_12055, partial [Bacteroidales bacterium]|nr:hypothetical protein [Bacteroidales bacterium]
GYRLSVIGCRLSVIGYRLSVVGCRLSVIGYRLSVVEFKNRKNNAAGLQDPTQSIHGQWHIF